MNFVGRDVELAQLDAAFGRTLDAQRQIVFIAGEAGAGKTTLVETFLGRTVMRNTSSRGQCIEHRGSGEPYMALLDALGRLCRSSRGRAHHRAAPPRRTGLTAVTAVDPVR
ncbi:MAG TPA: ATP-binding protein [Thermoanaerobaculia bacterium]|nr:ATP-binding protein [Thermoanaerobaculia bacterium]